MNSTNDSLKYADINIGDKIPALEIPITASLISCAALATRDFEPCQGSSTKHGFTRCVYEYPYQSGINDTLRYRLVGA